MGEQLFQLEIFKLNDFLCSMEISTPESIEVMKENILLGLENCKYNLAPPERVIVSNGKSSKRGVSNIEIIDVDEEPVDILQGSSKISLNSYDQKISDRFVNLENRQLGLEKCNKLAQQKRVSRSNDKSIKRSISNIEIIDVDEEPIDMIQGSSKNFLNSQGFDRFVNLENRKMHLKNCNILTQQKPVIRSNAKGVKRSVSNIEIIDVDEEPIDIIQGNSKIFLNSHDQKVSDGFVNLENRQKRLENESRCKVDTVDENISLQPKETIEKNEDVMIVDEIPSEYKRMLRKRTRQPYNDNDKTDQIDIKKPNTSNKIEKYYLNKKVNKLHSTLETIFEEPKHQNDKVLYVSAKKLKRVVNFHEDIARSTKLKSKKRLIRAKKVPSSKNFINRTKVSMETLMNKLTSLE